MTPPIALKVRVARKVLEARDIFSFELVSASAAPLPAFSAGAHIDVHLPNGMTRPYSLCNDPRERGRYLIGVLRDPHSRGGSQALHEQVQEGDILTIGEPKNHFPLGPRAGRSLLLGGGIGVTPMLAMAETLAHEGADFALHYCTRSDERTAFRSRITQSPFAARVHYHLDDGADRQKLNLQEILAEPAATTQLYVCGPKGLMDAVLAQARALGWQEAQLHSEFFGAQVHTQDADAAFEITIASSGQRIEVPKDMTVARALAAAGVDIMTACEQGVCGTCLTRVLAGTPDHRDSYLTAEEQAANDQFLPCCSRAKTSSLTLDI